MSHKYDSRTTIFSPEGRLYQVEYAIDLIKQSGGAAIGVRTKDGIVLAAKKKMSSKLLDTDLVGNKKEKLYKIDDHIACAVAGLSADANKLIYQCRMEAQNYRERFGQAIPVQILVRLICDRKQRVTQSGGLRPFGVSLIYAGWDRQIGYQLLQSDPSGNFQGWKATAIGESQQEATERLKSDYDETMTIEEGIQLIIGIFSKSIDGALTKERVELSTITKINDEVNFRIYAENELEKYLDEANTEKEKEQQES